MRNNQNMIISTFDVPFFMYSTDFFTKGNKDDDGVSEMGSLKFDKIG